jgi:hypothetical protein
MINFLAILKDLQHIYEQALKDARYQHALQSKKLQMDILKKMQQRLCLSHLSNEDLSQLLLLITLNTDISSKEIADSSCDKSLPLPKSATDG